MEVKSPGTLNAIRFNLTPSPLTHATNNVEFCALCALYPGLITVLFLTTLLKGEGEGQWTHLNYCKKWFLPLDLDVGYLSFV